jgi:integrase/recombinase XerD
MLVLHRRHTRTCPHRSRSYRKCFCPLWIDWKVEGRRIQRPIGTREWSVAVLRAREIEATGLQAGTSPQTVEQAAHKFLLDVEARGLRESSRRKYQYVLDQLIEFGQQRGYIFLGQLGLDELRLFRQSWTNQGLSAQKKLENLRGFFRFCHDSDWIKTNPAKKIKMGRVESVQVLPFEDSDIEKILTACLTHPIKQRRIELKALVLLMRHSGLRIGDAVTLRQDRIKGGMLELHTAKSGTKVRLPLNPIVLAALHELPAGTYFFWNGKATRESIVKIWERTFQRIFVKAGLPGAHSHQFRHTFAVHLLQAGVTMQNVSALLAHRSIKVTEKYYAAWTKVRQEGLEEAVRSAW